MNCESCALTFMKLDDLREHASSEKHRNQVINHFSCLLCSQPLQNIPDVMKHMESEEHSLMVVAADNPFDDIQQQSTTKPFPPIYFCMLCGCREENPYGIHLKSAIHKNIARLIKSIFSTKTVHYTNDGCDEELFKNLKNPNVPVYCNLCSNYSSNWYKYKEHLSTSLHMKTQVFMNKLVNVRECPVDTHTCDDICYSFPFICELCNLHFTSHDNYTYHLENQTHKRVKMFMKEISHMLMKMDVIIRNCDLKTSETFSNSLPPLYYCEMCDTFCSKAKGYAEHKTGFIHKRIEELLNKLSDKRKGNVIRICLKEGNGTMTELQFYCKLCIINFPDLTSFNSHLKNEQHMKIEHFINNLTDESDSNFIDIYIDAQAHLTFRDAPPRNYCETCNILHSKFEKYEQHLKSEEHKQSEQSLLRKRYELDDGGKSFKKLKTSSLENQENRLVIESNNGVEERSLNGIHQTNIAVFNAPTESFNSNCSPWLPFSNQETYNNPSPWLRTDNYATNYPPSPGHLHQANINYDPRLGGQHITSNDYSPWSDGQHHSNNNYPFWPSEQHHASNNDPFWPSDQHHASNNYPFWPSDQHHASNNRPSFEYQPNAVHDIPPWNSYKKYSNNPPPPWSNFQNFGYYSPYNRFEPSATNRNGYPFPGFEGPEYASNIHNSPLTSFEAHQSFTRSSNHFPRIAVETIESDIHPPGVDYESFMSNQELRRNVIQAPNNCPPVYEEVNSHHAHYCELCDITCSTSLHYDKHLKSEKHKKLRKLLNRKEKKACLLQAAISDAAAHPLQYNCEICDVFNRSLQEYEYHVKSDKHKKNQWLWYVLRQRHSIN